MGELKTVTQVDLGDVAIDTSKVTPLPTSERIRTITIERTGGTAVLVWGILHFR
jgi:hypothetical protein